MKKVTLTMVALLIVMSIPVFANPNPEQPYKLIIEAIEKGDIDRADHWIGVTMNDFPDSKEAMLAHWLRISIDNSRIYAKTELCGAYLVGASKGLKNGHFDASIASPSFYSYLLSFSLKHNRDDGIPAFLNAYSPDAIYDFGLEPSRINLDYEDVELEIKYIAMGVPSDLTKTELEKELKLKHLVGDVHLLSSLQSPDPIGRAYFFINLSRAIKIGVTYMDFFDTELKYYGKYREGMINTALECVEFALSHTESNPYTNARADAEKLKKELLDTKAKIEAE